jgi:hypothetical protein
MDLPHICNQQYLIFMSNVNRYRTLQDLKWHIKIKRLKATNFSQLNRRFKWRIKIGGLKETNLSNLKHLYDRKSECQVVDQASLIWNGLDSSG